MEVAVVCPSRNDFWDFVYLDRLLLSLHQSDFPQSYPLFLTIGYGWGSRRDSVDRALKCTDAQYILVADNDMYVPQAWWNEVVRIFGTDPKIGVVNPLVNFTTDQVAPPNRKHIPPPDETITDYHRPDVIHDGFVVFKRQFLLETGIRDSQFNPDVVTDWRIVIANHVTIKHEKTLGTIRVGAEGEHQQQHIDPEMEETMVENPREIH